MPKKATKAKPQAKKKVKTTKTSTSRGVAHCNAKAANGDNNNNNNNNDDNNKNINNNKNIKNRLNYYMRETKKLRETVKSLRDENQRVSSKYNELLSVVKSSNLHFKIAQRNLDQDVAARNVLLDLIDSENKEFFMREEGFYDDDIIDDWDDDESMVYGTLLHSILVAGNNSNSRFRNNFDVPMKLIELGGKELIFAQDSCGRDALRLACSSSHVMDFASHGLIQKIIQVGGRELVLAQNEIDGGNALHTLFAFKPLSIAAIIDAINVGGKEIAIHRDYHSRNALHLACERFLFPVYALLLSKLIDAGGAELMSMRNCNDESPIHILIVGAMIRYEDMDFDGEDGDETEGAMVDALGSMLCRGIIDYKIDGEFGFAGLFESTSDRVQEAIMDKWHDLIFPALLKHSSNFFNSKAPILQSALINRAPSTIIKDIAEYLDCISIKDSMGRYPIDVAIELGLGWDEGMK